MDWTAPYLVAALATLFAIEVWFVASLLFIGHRYRATRRAAGTSDPSAGHPALDHEELGLLAGGEQRWSEVALVRLFLEGHLREEGLIVLDHDPGESSAADQPQSARDAILRRLRGRRPAHLLDVVYAGQAHGDSSGAYRRLSTLGLVDAGAVVVARTRQRVMVAYLPLLLAGLVGTAVCMAFAADSDPAPPVLGSMSATAVCLAVTALASRLGGARFEVITPRGRDVLAQAADDVPGPADDRLLHRAALQGLSIVPELAWASTHGQPQEDLTTGQQGFGAAADLFSAIVGLFSGSGTSGTKR